MSSGWPVLGRRDRTGLSLLRAQHSTPQSHPQGVVTAAAAAPESRCIRGEGQAMPYRSRSVAGRVSFASVSLALSLRHVRQRRVPRFTTNSR